MSAQVLRFPNKQKTVVYKIPLYTDEEIFLTVLAVNIFSLFSYKITATTLENCDSEIVLSAITKASTSDIFSNSAKFTYIEILNAVEKFET
jgi:hypothetical protein